MQNAKCLMQNAKVGNSFRIFHFASFIFALNILSHLGALRVSVVIPEIGKLLLGRSLLLRVNDEGTLAAMRQYIVLIHSNVASEPTAEEWEAFFDAARESGMFRSGSAIEKRTIVGDGRAAGATEQIVGYMRFDSDDEGQLLELLKRHPIVAHDGSVELCELPKT